MNSDEPPIRCSHRGIPPINYQQLHSGNIEGISDEEDIISNQEHAMKQKMSKHLQLNSSVINQDEVEINDLVYQFTQLNVTNLKIELKNRGLSQKGRKKELQKRLLEATGLTQAIHELSHTHLEEAMHTCNPSFDDDVSQHGHEETNKQEGNTAVSPCNSNTTAVTPQTIIISHVHPEHERNEQEVNISASSHALNSTAEVLTKADDTFNIDTPVSKISTVSSPIASDFTVEPLFTFPSPPSSFLSDTDPPSSLGSLRIRLSHLRCPESTGSSRNSTMFSTPLPYSPSMDSQLESELDNKTIIKAVLDMMVELEQLKKKVNEWIDPVASEIQKLVSELQRLVPPSTSQHATPSTSDHSQDRTNKHGNTIVSSTNTAVSLPQQLHHAQVHHHISTKQMTPKKESTSIPPLYTDTASSTSIPPLYTDTASKPQPPPQAAEPNKWQTAVNKTRKGKRLKAAPQSTSVPTSNKFLPLYTFGSLRCQNGNNNEVLQNMDDDEASGIEKGIAPSPPTRPQVAINKSPEREMYFKRRKPVPIVPGNRKYSEAAQKNISLITDSMARSLRATTLNKYIGKSNGHVIPHRYPGHTADEIKHYVYKNLYDDKPNTVVIIAGINDILRHGRDGSIPDISKITDDILEIGRICKEKQVEKVFISGIMANNDVLYNHVGMVINDSLKLQCEQEGFIFIDQSYIKCKDLANDGLHLSDLGSTKLLDNLLNCFIDNYNPYDF